ncbi:hypothetical protein DFH09DRAFT_1277513 [Mycena vulgaris]|nr:hypothetical protein DFH09DRAFT_1277513 [Mycena vulgaris]
MQKHETQRCNPEKRAEHKAALRTGNKAKEALRTHDAEQGAKGRRALPTRRDAFLLLSIRKQWMKARRPLSSIVGATPRTQHSTPSTAAIILACARRVRHHPRARVRTMRPTPSSATPSRWRHHPRTRTPPPAPCGDANADDAHPTLELLVCVCPRSARTPSPPPALRAYADDGARKVMQCAPALFPPVRGGESATILPPSVAAVRMPTRSRRCNPATCTAHADEVSSTLLRCPFAPPFARPKPPPQSVRVRGHPPIRVGGHVIAPGWMRKEQDYAPTWASCAMLSRYHGASALSASKYGRAGGAGVFERGSRGRICLLMAAFGGNAKMNHNTTPRGIQTVPRQDELEVGGRGDEPERLRAATFFEEKPTDNTELGLILMRLFQVGRKFERNGPSSGVMVSNIITRLIRECVERKAAARSGRRDSVSGRDGSGFDPDADETESPPDTSGTTALRFAWVQRGPGIIQSRSKSDDCIY